MADLREALAFLTNPAPVFQDPEDNEDDTNAKVVGRSTEDDRDESSIQVSSLRRKTALSTADLGEKYAGRKISRKKLSSFDDNDEEQDSDDEGIFEEYEMEEGDESESGSDESDDDDDEAETIKSFQNKVNLKTKSFSFSDDGDYSKYADMDNEDDSSNTYDSDDEDAEESDESDESNEEEDAMEDDLNDTGGVKKFSKTDTGDEVEKGNAAKVQLGLWDSLLQNRIKLQKVLGLVNQLPQPGDWASFEQSGTEEGENFKLKSQSAQASLQTLLDKLLQLQAVLLLQNNETRHVVMGTKNSSQTDPKSAKVKNVTDEDDEEITSESESEDKEEEDSLKTLIVKAGIKRKHGPDQYSEILTKRHKDFLSFRNTTIQKWYDKTRLVSGKINSKSFSSFDQSALKQIEQILHDKERLIKRTQLKRSIFRVLGKKEKNAEQGETTKDTLPSTETEDLKTYDSEIFDDSDFYHQQLRELIEKKAADTSDPVALSRHWIEIQKLRSKVKAKVDTKASKGRKVRYDIHKKLVNFMAPEDRCTWTEEARDDLCKSLFGKRFLQSAPPIASDQNLDGS